MAFIGEEIVKIFDRQEPFDTKVNFVDENGVVLGYDMVGTCCEDFGWYISDMSQGEELTPIPNLDSYRFDTKYFENKSINEICDIKSLIIFRIVDKQGSLPPLFIHLYNYHNGYYAHGFEFTHNLKLIQEGGI